MKNIFTVRLPLRSDRTTQRAIASRAQTDGRISDFVLEALLGSGRPNNDPDLLVFAIGAVEEFALHSGNDEEWVSDHVAAAYRSLAEYRTALKEASRTKNSTEIPMVRRAAARNARGLNTRATIDRKSAFGVDWEDAEVALLDLIRSGKGALTYDVKSIGSITLRGAGPRDLGDEARISRTYIEHRGDRDYLTAVVSHWTLGERPALNHDYAEVVRIAVTSATIVADSESISVVEMVDEGSSIRELSGKTRRWRSDGATHRRVARRMMDSRNNFFRQYAVRVADFAEENNLGVELSFHEGNTSTHPKILGASIAHRKIIVAELFRQCGKRGVVFLFPRTSTDVEYESCPHPGNVVVGRLDGNTVVGLCAQCAEASRVVE